MRRRSLPFVTAAAALLLTAHSAFALPTTLPVEGRLLSTTGPAADGAYTVTFSLYEGMTNQTPFWQSAGVKVAVKGGWFQYALGSAKAITGAALSSKKDVWIGLRIGSDPEFTRQLLHSQAFALVAGSADGLACTGCVSVQAMKFNDNIDLGAAGLKAKTLTAETVSANTVQAQAFVGDGSKLTGLKMPSGTCAAGKVVAGINADGTLKCASTAASLPKDGLDEISNGVLKNQFVETFEIPAGDKGKAIPDNTGVELVSTISIPNIGTTEEFFKVTVDLQNSDLSTLSVSLLPSDDKKVGMVLCDPCGNKNEKVLKTTFPTPQAVKKGDLKKYIGKNPAGTWNLKLKDVSFCIPQLDKVNCDVNAVTDGKLNYWAISTQVLSSAKVQVTGDLVVTGKLTEQGTPEVVEHPMFPKGSTPFLFGELQDRMYRQYQYGARYAYGSNVPKDNDGLHDAVRAVKYGDANGNIVIQRGGGNYNNSQYDDSQMVLVAFVKNDTDKDIAHKVYLYYSSQSGSNNYASLALNGSNVWTYTSTNSGTTNVNVTFPKKTTSVLVLKTGARYYTYSYRSPYFKRNIIGFYNNSMKLPTGLSYDYERYAAWLTGK